MWQEVLVALLFLQIYQCYEEIQPSEGSSFNPEFPHFLHRAYDSKRAHLISEHIRNGFRLQIEEYIDLNSWNQLIQFKWQEDVRVKDDQLTINPQELNVLIVNDGDRKFLTRYGSFHCSSAIYSSISHDSKENWQTLIQSEELNSPSTLRQAHLQSIESILSTSKNSPYLARIPINHNQTDEKWIFGISGLWLNAQYPSSQSNQARSLSYQEDHHNWKLDLPDADASLIYSFESGFFGNLQSDTLSNTEYDSVSMIELSNFKDSTTIDLINIIDADFTVDEPKFSDLFKLPIAHGCPSNPLLTNQKLVFENFQHSKLLELEVVAKKIITHHNIEVISSTEIKNVEVATSPHPIDQDELVTMFHILEDQVKVVRDFHSKLSYNIDKNGVHESCLINKLLCDSKTSSKNASCDPINLNFVNGISIALGEFFLSSIIEGEYTNSNMRLINYHSVSKYRDRFEFELNSDPDLAKSLLKVYTEEGEANLKNLIINRVYVRKVNPLVPNRYRQKGPLKLSEVILTLLNANQTAKLVELRINLIHKIQPTSFTRNAKIFDISDCFKTNFMDVIVSYPMESRILERVEEISHEFVEELYKSFQSWLYVNTSEDDEAFEKSRIGKSLNFLRIPSVELKLSFDGTLELHLVLIDKPSPLYLFDKIDDATIVSEGIINRFLVKTNAECAEFCQVLDCGTMAFDFLTKECIIGARSVAKQSSSGCQSENGCLKLKMKESSTVYFLRHEYDEASLNEIHSYLHHTDTSSIGNEMPLLSFKVRDWFEYSFGPPKYFNLTPSQIRVASKLSLEDSDTLKVASSFRSDIYGKAYYLSSQQQYDFSDTTLMDKTFIDYQNLTYYTLRRLQLLELSSCSLMCFNIEGWDSATGSEQTCISFSYCSLEQECILLVKTDFSFTSSILDVADEGDRVSEFTSVDDLTRINRGCNVYARNYLNKFAGPIETSAKRIVDQDSFRSSQINFEWSLEFTIETKGLSFSDTQEKCAKKCIDYNRGQGLQVCIALDLCLKNNIVEKNYTFVKLKEVSCSVFLISKSTKYNKSEYMKGIAILREKLSRRQNVAGGKTSLDSKCSRYLVSHLLEFTHLKQRKISQNIRELLHQPVPTIKDINLDNCALECSLRSPRCVTFEYCTRIGKETRLIEAECIIFEAPKSNLSKKLESINSSNTEVSTFSRGCQVYLRSDVKSIESLLKVDTDIMVEPDFMNLIFPFALIYLTIVVAILIYSDIIKLSFLRN